MDGHYNELLSEYVKRLSPLSNTVVSLFETRNTVSMVGKRQPISELTWVRRVSYKRMS